MRPQDVSPRYWWFPITGFLLRYIWAKQTDHAQATFVRQDYADHACPAWDSRGDSGTDQVHAESHCDGYERKLCQ